MADLMRPTEQMKGLLRTVGSNDPKESLAAQYELAEALTLPLRQGVLSGPILGNIFQSVPVESTNSTFEYPLDMLTPGSEGDFVAFTIPNHGRIPGRHVESDYITIPIYDIGNGIEWNMKYARDARWDIVRRAIEIMRMGFVKKLNDDGWHTILAAAADRNIIVYDADASAGQFTKRLVSLAKLTMRRNGGGNSTSTNRGLLTDLFVSPEAVEDMRSWGVDQVDDTTRRQIWLADDGSLNNIFSVNIIAYDEFGVGQEYETYLETDLSVSPVSTGSDVELGVGLDLRAKDSFVMPVKQEVQIFPDESMHRRRKMGYYGWAEQGFAVLDNRRCILISM